MLLKVLAREYPRKILNLLNEKEVMYFRQINEEIPIHKSSLARILNELVKYGLLEKWEEPTDDKRKKTYYKLTEKGKKALIIYQLEKELENLKENQTIIINYKIINCKNHNVINANIVNINQK